jgi:hypothetical protein
MEVTRKMKQEGIKIVALALASFLMLVCIVAASPDSTLLFIDPTPANSTHRMAMNLNNDLAIGENSSYAKDDVTFTQEQEFQWGLVSLNTKRSIYKPDETAELIIVVLDKEGHSVCDADISMTVTNPNNEKTTYSTANSTITPGSECGICNADYPTEVEGNHTIDVTAQTLEKFDQNASTVDGVEVSFNTYFLVQRDYEFDIIRTAQSKIDPTRQDWFEVRIDVENFTDADTVTIKEFVPASFNVSADAATVLLEDDIKTITWNKDLIENKASVTYSYAVPHIWPYLYALGPAEIGYDSKTFTEARPWYVAVDPTYITESLWSESNSVSTTQLTLTNSAYTNGPTTGNFADASGQWAKSPYEWWEFVMADSTKAGTINSVWLYLKHYQSGWVDDNFLIQIYDGSTWHTVQTYTSVSGPPTDDTTNFWDVKTLGGIDTWTEINAAKVKIIGNGKTGQEDTVDWFVDTVELRIEYTPTWDSYKTDYPDQLPPGTQCDDFVNYAEEHQVYMYGVGFTSGESYKVVYWDADGTKRMVDTGVTVAVDSKLRSTWTFAPGQATQGNWHVTVYYPSDYPTGDTYSASDSHIVVDDTSYSMRVRIRG